MFRRWWKRTEAREPTPEPQPAAATDSSADQPFITIDGHRYASAELPADVISMIDNVRMADSLLQLRRDKILLLRAAAHQLRNELRLRLTDRPALSS